MAAILTLIVVLMISLIIVRVATVALTLTGLSRDLARFQARSAFSGAGFTTGESEQVVSHPVRRRIIMLLMLLGNAGIVTVISTLVLSLSNPAAETGGLTSSLWYRILIIIGGLVLLMLISQSAYIDRWMSRIIAWALKRWTTLDARDYANLLHLSRDYAVSELLVQPDDWLAGKTLIELRLNQEGVLVLGISRKGGGYDGAPRGQTAIEAGDTLLIYGREKTLADLDQRRIGPEGGHQHIQAVVEQINLEKAAEENIEEEKAEVGEE